MADDTRPEEVYVAVRRGVRDGLWDVLGTAATVVFAALLFLFGASVFAAGVSGDTPTSYGLLALGVLLFAAAAYELTTTMGYRPREWL